MNHHVGILLDLINESFEDNQIYISNTKTNNTPVVQITVNEDIHRYATGRLQRNALLDRIKKSFLKQLALKDYQCVYINDFYIDNYSTELKLEYTITFHVSIGDAHE